MTTVDAIVQNVPADRRADFEAVRKVVNDNLPPGYVETVGFGMLAWVIPRARYPETYNGQPLMLASLAAQKSYSSLYLLGIYGAEDGRAWLEREWKKTGKKLDMGKSCVRFQKAADLALDVIGAAIARTSVDDYIARYEAVRAATKGGQQAAKKAAAKTSSSSSSSKKKKKAAATKKTASTAKPTAKKKPAKKSQAKK